MGYQVLTTYCTCKNCGDINGYSNRDLITKVVQHNSYDTERKYGIGKAHYDVYSSITYRVVEEIYLFICPTCGYRNQVGSKILEKEEIDRKNTYYSDT